MPGGSHNSGHPHVQRVAVTIPLGAITAIAVQLLRIPATAG